MIKKCIGCGKTLQNESPDNLGFTPDLKNDYCKRCFRLKNYGEKNTNETVDEVNILKRVNKMRGVVFFLIDYLNLNKYTLDIFKEINIPKVLIISKSDTLRSDMKHHKITNWLKKVYNINELVSFVSSKNNFRNINIFKIMDNLNTNTCFIMGITNAGKSTFINSILKEKGIKKEIVTSNKPNTTLDFIKLKIKDYVIYDTPGFSYLNLDKKIINKEIKPITFNITRETTIIIDDNIKLYIDTPNSVTLYITEASVKRVFKNTVQNPKIIPAFDNSDLILPGMGYINIKKACQVLSNIDIPEVRIDISEEEYE